MPNITIPISDSYNLITRPVSMSIAKDILRLCAMDEKTPLRIAGERGVTSQLGTDGTGQEIRFESDARLEATVDERVRSNTLLSTVVRRPDVTPTLYDANLGITLRTTYVQHDMAFEFKYVAKNKSGAEAWIKEVTARIAEGRSGIHHSIEYYVAIDDGILVTLQHLYQLRENLVGYGDTFTQWFNSLQLREIKLLSMENGDTHNGTLAVTERQAHNSGYFEFGEIPKEVKDNDEVTWVVEFTYRYTYQKPMKWQLVYPMMIHQSHVGRGFYEEQARYSLDHLNTALASRTQRALNRIRWMYTGRTPPPDGGLRWPFHDDWYTPKGPFEYTQPVLTVLIQVLPEDTQLVIDLKDLPDMDWTDSMFQYLKVNHSILHQRGAALALVTLYSGDGAMDPSTITVDDHLVVRSVKPMDLRKMYHVRISFVTAHHTLTGHAINTLTQHPIATLEMLQTLMPALDVEWAVQHAIQDDRLSASYIYWALDQTQWMGIGIWSDHLKRVRTRAFDEDIPTVNVLKDAHPRTGVPLAKPFRDPGEYKARNTPKPQSPPELEFYTEEELRKPPISYVETATPRSMSPDNLIYNVNSPMKTVQYLAIFAAKR